MTPTEAVARYIHQWQALDKGHGKYTERCICNHHARGIMGVLTPPEPPLAADDFRMEGVSSAEWDAFEAAIEDKPPLAVAARPFLWHPCVGKDPACPCQDGDPCHYIDYGDGIKPLAAAGLDELLPTAEALLRYVEDRADPADDDFTDVHRAVIRRVAKAPLAAAGLREAVREANDAFADIWTWHDGDDALLDRLPEALVSHIDRAFTATQAALAAHPEPGS